MGLARSKTARAVGAAALAVVALLVGAAGAPAAVSDQPQIAVDRDGNAHFTWRHTTGVDMVKTRKRNANGTFGAVQDLSFAGTNAERPQVAVDPQGDAYFVWIQHTFANSIVRARKREASGTLGAAQDLSPAAGNAYTPELAVDPQGNAYFVWTRFNGTHSIVQTRKRNANGTLSPVQDLSAAGRHAFEPQVAVDAQGNAYFTWRRENGSNSIAQFRRRLANGTLGPAQNLSVAGKNAYLPQVASTPQGAVHFVWQLEGFDPVQTRRLAAGSLGATQDLSPPGQAGTPGLALDPQGNASFVWRRDSVIETRRRAASGALSEVQEVGGHGGGFDPPKVAVDPTGTANFVWQSRDAGLDPPLAIFTRRRTAEGLLGSAERLSPNVSGVDADQSQLGVDPLGNAYFVWRRNGIIQTRRRAPDATLTPVQNVTG
jgi:hypothetical protein